MVDTIKLILDSNIFIITDVGRFQKEKMNAARGSFTLVQNPTPNELKNGIYKPRLTLTKRFNTTGRFEPTLAIEFSQPKLIFGNNFDEIEDSNFGQIVETLRQKLKEMGVLVFTALLENAPISSIHFSKNILLTDYSTPYSYIKQLEKVNFSAVLDTSQTDYFNGGYGIKAHSNSHEIVFYDKIRDLAKAKISSKRAYDKDSQIQLGLFDVLGKRKPFEVLRMEIRLSTRQKIRQILSRVGLTMEPTLKNLFSKEVSQKVLLYYLQTIEDGYPPLLNYDYNDPQQFLTNFMTNNPDKRLASALKYLGMRVLLEKMGVHEFRQLISGFSNHAWYDLNRKMKNLTLTNKVDTFGLLRNAIANYQPLRLVDHRQFMLNNDKVH